MCQTKMGRRSTAGTTEKIWGDLGRMHADQGGRADCPAIKASLSEPA